MRGRRKVVGAQTLVGQEAEVLAPCRPTGQVRIGGEIWEARCEDGADAGETVRVVGLRRAHAPRRARLIRPVPSSRPR